MCGSILDFDANALYFQAIGQPMPVGAFVRRLADNGFRPELRDKFMVAYYWMDWLEHTCNMKIQHKLNTGREVKEQRCFKEFEREVSEARRQGGADPDTAIIAETNKVIGNSSYGSLIMDKTKHSDVQYVQGENETCLQVNDPRFSKLECLDQEEQYYEIEMSKRKIKLDLPIQFGYFILQYAKLRMLEFYNDFMDVYVVRIWPCRRCPCPSRSIRSPGGRRRRP
ncbi:hypothetical protein MAR_021234 [Mya arenaria]|uniref:Uncharacterized protein n=1 Tax=Mya arenaria TaxID=6604 RepID=A0ABY7E7L9_MYAAR|nr:hypothetical protein MAR_021234 [Mya arenaria]